MTETIKNKVILVTGASGGIGSAIVNKLAGSGSKVIAAYNKNLPDFSDYENISLIKADFEISDEWNRVLHFVSHQYGKLDVLINCTGVLIPGIFVNHTIEQITEMIETNLTSVLIGTNKTLKLMRKQRFGHIINLGSVGGIVPMPYSSVYSATKFALRGFTHSVAQEIKNSGVTITLISPGPVNTHMLELEAKHKKTAIAFMNKVLEPERVADSVIKLIHNPKTEVIVPKTLSLLSKTVFFFPGFFSKTYKLIEKIGKWRKKFYLQRPFDLSLQK